MAARDSFLRRHAALTDACVAEAVQTKPLHETTWNERAGVLRNGLMVVAFSTLEDFLRSRTSELLNTLGGGSVPFGSLPKRLQRATTIEAVQGLRFQLPIRESRGDDGTLFAQTVAAAIASTKGHPYELSGLGLGWTASNISQDDIAHILKVFGVKAAWTQMTAIADRVGFGAVPLDAQLATAAQRRHQAAHDPNTDVALGDLTSFLTQALAIALAFDCLVTRGTRLLRDGDPGRLVAGTAIKQADINIRYLDCRATFAWAEIAEKAARAHRVHPSQQAGIVAAAPRARASHSALVIRSSARTPIEWRVDGV